MNVAAATPFHNIVTQVIKTLFTNGTVATIKRVEDGTASDARAAERGALAADLAELGWQFALKAGASE